MARTQVTAGTTGRPSPRASSTHEVSDRTQFCQRARLRLIIAARLLHIAQGDIEEDDAFLRKVLGIIRAMSSPRQSELRALVDWVEEYSHAEPVQKMIHRPN